MKKNDKKIKQNNEKIEKLIKQNEELIKSVSSIRDLQKIEYIFKELERFFAIRDSRALHVTNMNIVKEVGMILIMVDEMGDYIKFDIRSFRKRLRDIMPELF